MAKSYELHYLTQEFYKMYAQNTYPEIENKGNRPYIVLLVKIKDNTFAIPFRTNIRHKYGYKFKKSNRKTDSITGLDFTKAVIVNDSIFIGDFAKIDDDEYLELNRKLYFIVSGFNKYISDYYRYVKGELNEYQGQKYRYSTLKYFHNELKIDEIKENEG